MALTETSYGQARGNRPGRKPGPVSGRGKAILVLDQMIAKESNLKRLGKAFQEAFDNNPLKFFLNVLAPLIPKETIVAVLESSRGASILEQLVEAREEIIELVPETPKELPEPDHEGGPPTPGQP